MSGTEQAPAIGYSIVSNIGGDRQMTVQCFVAQDEDDASINTKIDRIFRIVDRQKARYELTDLRDELLKHRETLAQAEEDLAKVDAEFEKSQASIDVQILELNQRKDEEQKAGYAEHAASGRQGDYKPKGAREANIRNIEVGINGLKADKAKNVAERDQHRQNVLISITRFQKAIAALEEKIAAREALLKD